jgi:hypothetical protein
MGNAEWGVKISKLPTQSETGISDVQISNPQSAIPAYRQVGEI